MDELIAPFSSSISLGPEPIISYEQAFDQIVLFATKARGHIPPNELAVTKTLAGPFNPGGLLILLLEPLLSHPWGEGVDRVIATCATLDSLNEGVQIASNGDLSLKDDVSVLDLCPFFAKEQYSTLDCDCKAALYNLVFSAIEAKEPEALLCMGNVSKIPETIPLREQAKRLQVPKAALDARRTEADFLRSTEITYAIHPSYSVNRNEADAEMRQKLFRSISKACANLREERHDNIWEEQVRMNPTVSEETPESMSRLEVSKNSRCLGNFLEVVLRSCFLPKHRLPASNIVKGVRRRYDLESWQNKWFSHMEESLDSTAHHEDQARAFLIPVFKLINRSLRRTSWFLPIYEVADLPEVCQVFADRLPEIEYACYLLSGDTGADRHFVAGEREHGPAHRDVYDVLTKMDEITERATQLWENTQPHPPRISWYVGF